MPLRRDKSDGQDGRHNTVQGNKTHHHTKLKAGKTVTKRTKKMIEKETFFLANYAPMTYSEI
jgi:hypothetical protein